jgi:hypothetical protein
VGSTDTADGIRGMLPTERAEVGAGAWQLDGVESNGPTNPTTNGEVPNSVMEAMPAGSADKLTTADLRQKELIAGSEGEKTLEDSPLEIQLASCEVERTSRMTTKG